MDFRKIASSSLRWLAPVALFFVIAAAYFAPQFEGRVLAQHDVQQYGGMTSDILDSRERYGEDPQWTGRMFGGMPSYLINTYYPAEWIKHSVGQVVKVIDQPASFVFFAMVAFWAMLLLMRVRRWPAVVGAVAYGLSTYFFLIIGAGHITKMWALVYAPLMVGAVWYAFKRNRWAGAAMTSLFTALQVGANHPQITYYFVLVMGAMWIALLVEAVREGALRRFAMTTVVVALAGLLGVGANFSPLWYTMQHQPETIRGGSELAVAADGSEGLDLQYATAWSYGRTESLNLLVPNLMGGASNETFAADGAVAEALRPYGLQSVAEQLPRYWGDQPFTAGPTYLGAAAVLLAVLGCFVLRGRAKWWIVVISAVALLLSWGRNMMWLTELCFNYLPAYDKFRTVSMIQVIVQWSIPLLAALALSRLDDEECDRAKAERGLYWATGIVGGVCLVIALFAGSLFEFGQAEAETIMTEEWHSMLSYQQGGEQYIAQGLHEELGLITAEAMAKERAAAASADAWRSLAFVLLTAAMVWLYLRGKVRYAVAMAVVAATVVVDLVAVNLRYLPQSAFVSARRTEVVPNEADRYIMNDKELGFRVLNLTVSPFNDATTSYFHRSVGGYHGAKLSRYQDIIDNYLSTVNYGVDSTARKVLDMLNTKYLIVPTAEGIALNPNPTQCGAAWFVDRIYLTESPRDEIDALAEIDPHTEAVVDVRWAEEVEPIDLSDEFEAEIALTEYRPNYLRYEYEASGTGVAIFSEIYYNKGWTAYIDGAEAPYYRANYILRAMTLPAGKHTVEWRFRAPAFGKVEAVTLCSSIAILASVVAVVVAAVVRRRKQSKNQTNDER
ncbi:MAG: YfhO family protein [Rikenellaceae bacterium]|nr:YfhO family protein [Rikenellaceae bacterium]